MPARYWNGSGLKSSKGILLGKRNIGFMQNILYILEAVLVIPIATILGLLPRFAARALAKAIGFLLNLLAVRSKKIAMKNLDVIYSGGEKTLKEKKAIIKSLTYNVARFAVEYLQLSRVNSRNYHRYAVLDGLENIQEALKENKGVIVVTAHVGNWEFLGSIPAKLGIDLGVIINRQFNPYTDAWLRNIREYGGKIKNFYNEVSDMVRISRHIRKGGVIGILIDQTYYFHPIFVPFFGKSSATADGAARFHLKFGAPMLTAFSIRQPDGRYLLRYNKPFHFKKSGDMEKDILDLTAWINSEYEKIIREYPDQWFSLFHDRWERTRPEDFKDIDWDPY